MRFLMTSLSQTPPPPEAVLPLMEAFKAWLAEHREAGRIVESWNFAGMTGGGGIAEVESLEELDAMLATYPWMPFSDVKVYGLTDLDEAVERNISAVQERMAAMASG